MTAIRFFTILLSFSLSGCAGVTCYFHNCHDQSEPLTSVSLGLGEKQQAISDTRGFAPGGYFWGLIAEDPSIVKIDYEENGRTTSVYLTGSSEGTTEVYYINRAVMPDPTKSINSYGLDSQYVKEDSRHFTVDVKSH